MKSITRFCIISNRPSKPSNCKPDCASNDSFESLWAQSNNKNIPNILCTAYKRINHARNSMKTDAIHYQIYQIFNSRNIQNIPSSMCSPFSQRFAREWIWKWRNKNQICVILRVLNLRDDSIFYRHQIPLNCYGGFGFTGVFWWNHWYNIFVESLKRRDQGLEA